MLGFASKQGGYHPNVCKGVPSQGWRVFILRSPPTTSKGEILESSPGAPIPQGGTTQTRARECFNPEGWWALILSPPPNIHPKGENITTPARGASLSQGGDNSNPRKGAFNSQGWWVLILSPLPTLLSGKTLQTSQGCSTPKGGGL